MRQVRVKPAAFKYFHNSKIYYLVGTVLDPLIDGSSIFLPRGTIIQLVFSSETLGRINLSDSQELLCFVEDLAQETIIRGRRLLRFTVNQIHADY